MISGLMEIETSLGWDRLGLLLHIIGCGCYEVYFVPTLQHVLWVRNYEEGINYPLDSTVELIYLYRGSTIEVRTLGLVFMSTPLRKPLQVKMLI